MAKVSKVSLKKAIDAHGGVIAEIAEYYDVSRQTIYNWLDKYKLRALVASARQDIKTIARDNLYGALLGGDVDVSKWVLLNMGDDGEVRFSADALRALAVLGLDVRDAVQQFETLIHAEAMKADAE